MTKPRYRLRSDGRAQRIPADATKRFIAAAMERWSEVKSRSGISPDPYAPSICDAHGVHLRDVIAALNGKTTPSATRARAMLAWMGIDCATQSIQEATPEQAVALEQLLSRTKDLIKEFHRERRMASLRLYIREFPDLARAEVASLTR